MQVVFWPYFLFHDCAEKKNWRSNNQPINKAEIGRKPNIIHITFRLCTRGNAHIGKPNDDQLDMYIRCRTQVNKYDFLSIVSAWTFNRFSLAYLLLFAFRFHCLPISHHPTNYNNIFKVTGQKKNNNLLIIIQKIWIISLNFPSERFLLFWRIIILCILINNLLFNLINVTKPQIAVS